MKKETSLCMGCMAENAGSADICAVCGYAGNSVFLSSYLAPQTFLAERYIIGKLISYNGEGALYVAFDTQNNAKVTVREYMPDTLCSRKKDEEAVEVNPQYVALYKTYLSEFTELHRTLANMGGSLRIQKVLDVFTENNTAYAVYEFITGISLKSYLSNLGGVLPWEQVRELFSPLFTTLNLIHAAGIIHRGISPSSIFLNEKGELVLIDFQITASRTCDSEINHEVCAGYAGPEQYVNTARHGSWTDVYGVAAVLYKVLTGQMPPDAVSGREDDDLTEPMLINRNIPPSVSAAIMKGLVLDVDERTRTVNSLISGLFEAVPLSVPDTTNEILIKKPRKAEAESQQEAQYKSQTAGRSGSRNRRGKKQGSNVAAIVIFTLLGLVVLGFLIVIMNPDIVNPWLNNGQSENGDEEPANNEQPVPETPPVNTGTDSVSVATPPTPSQSNEPLYAIPDFTTRRFEAIQSSNTFRFLNFVPVYEFNDEFDEGVIFEQDIEPGTDVAADTEITVKVSKGPETALLPSYDGMKRDDYMKLLSDAKIKYSSEGEYSEGVLDDFVIRAQIGDRTIAAGDIVNIAEGDEVTVYYSLGLDPNLVLETPTPDDPVNGTEDTPEFS
jgi:serine/threonine-protein kinase